MTFIRIHHDYSLCFWFVVAMDVKSVVDFLLCEQHGTPKQKLWWRYGSIQRELRRNAHILDAKRNFLRPNQSKEVIAMVMGLNLQNHRRQSDKTTPCGISSTNIFKYPNERCAPANPHITEQMTLRSSVFCSPGYRWSQRLGMLTGSPKIKPIRCAIDENQKIKIMTQEMYTKADGC